MRIGINVSRLEGQRMGVGRYLEYMLKYWSGMLDANEEVHAYLRKPVPPETLSHLNIGPTIKFQIVGPTLTAALWENLSMAMAARKTDVLFGPSYTLPLSYRVPKRRVVAIHSVNEAQAGAHAGWYDWTYGNWYQLSALSADAVIVPGPSTADLVASRYGVPMSKIVVIPQGADTSFRPLGDPELDRSTRIRFLGEDVPYVLFVGSLSVRRNIPNLIAGFARARKEKQLPHKLLLLGRNHVNLDLTRIIEENGVSGAVVQTDGKFTHHQELISIYNAAEVFIQPSWFEGWSMTTIEALACGTATIIADRGGLRDTADGHAYLIKEPTVDAISDALCKVLLDEKLRQELRRIGRLRGSAITWEDTTRQTLEVIRNVARDRPPGP